MNHSIDFITNYFSSQLGTLAARLDMAWEVLNDKLKTENERQEALFFLVFVLEPMESFSCSPTPEIIVKELQALMMARERVKMTNPEYIPGQNSSHLTLPLEKRGRETNSREVSEAIKSGEMLRVNAASISTDVRYSTYFMSPEERAHYRLLIHQGRFYQRGQLYDSSDHISHKKKGFDAYTFNANGELSVFEHLGGRKDKYDRVLFHSSTNAGRPVLAAGELEIKNGKLLTISTHSGHYQPSLFSVYRLLGYLVSRGIDISHTKIMSERPVILAGVQSEKKLYSAAYGDVYLTKATDLYKVMKDTVCQPCLSLIDRYQQKRTAFFDTLFLNRALCQERRALADTLRYQLIFFMNHRTMTPSNIVVLLTLIRESIWKNNLLSTSYGKEVNSGQLATQLTKMLETVSETQRELKEEHWSEDARSYLKSIF